MLKRDLRWRVDTDRVTVVDADGKVIARAPDKTAATLIALAPVLMAGFLEKTNQAFAREQVRNAVRSGRLKPGPCRVCGAQETQAHHEDYAKPLEVEWLCPLHHHAADKARRVSLKMKQRDC